MSGKSIVFKVECTSPVYGSFRAGDVAHNVDAAWAGDLIKGGYAAETTKETQDADADAAADAAGRLTKRNRAGSQTKKVEHKFSSSDLAAQRAAGVVTTGPTDVTAGAEKTAARIAGQPAATASAAAAPPAPAAAPTPPKKTAPTNPTRPRATAKTVPDKKAAKAGKGKK